MHTSWGFSEVLGALCMGAGLHFSLQPEESVKAFPRVGVHGCLPLLLWNPSALSSHGGGEHRALMPVLLSLLSPCRPLGVNPKDLGKW